MRVTFYATFPMLPRAVANLVQRFLVFGGCAFATQFIRNVFYYLADVILQVDEYVMFSTIRRTQNPALVLSFFSMCSVPKENGRRF